ncbi:DUF116 domain-containing protein [Wukongibacter baidiensis]|uniref:DUF116 domain-containing protein n=1 Tax=Wukongibacter baidiensis TaxID=1723361 RepID=UPI003D7F29FE
MKNMILSKDKNVFLNILMMIILVMFLLAIGLVLLLRNSGLHLYIVIIGILVFIFIAIVMYLLGLLLLTIRIAKNGTMPRKLIPIFENSIKHIYPIMIMFSNMMKIEKDPIRRFFSEINNKIVILKSEKLRPEDILIITPHCLQKSLCKHKVTGDINNCQRCGACDIDKLLELCSKYNVKLEVVTGGTLARKIIKDHRPKGIIAVACERDLSHGILDVKRIPVIGIKNERPHGPCNNTIVNVDEVEEAIKHYLRR